MLSDWGLWIDSLGGAAQLLFALYLVSRRGATRQAILFALFFGLNGLAFLLRNLIPHGHALFPLLGGTVWGALNWLAAVTVIVFSLVGSRLRLFSQSIAVLVGVTLAVLSWASAPPSVTLVAFGGGAVYAAVATALIVLLADINGSVDVRSRALLTAILVVNSALHAGVGIVTRGSLYNYAHAGTLVAISLGWLFWRQTQGGSPGCVVLAVGAGPLLLLFGGMTAYSLGSQRAVQDSGLYGIGRMISAAAAMYVLRFALLSNRDEVPPALGAG